MIVLSRMRNESVVIDDDITVTFIDIRDDKARLGFEIPRDVSIHRREVYEAIQAQDRRAPILSGPSVPDPRTQVPTPPSSQVTLTERQTALIDRFRTSIRVATSTEPSREDAIVVLFQAFEQPGALLVRCDAWSAGVVNHGRSPLCSTGGSGNKDHRGDDSGKNWLGQIIMRVREGLRSQ
jgi:carbon storage regulator